MRYFLLSLALLCITATAQNRQAQRLDSIAGVFMADAKYDQAITTYYRELNALESAHPDSLYIAALVKIAICYDKQHIPMKAIESTKRALDLYSLDHPAEDLYKAGLYDRIALYYHSMRNFPEAFRWSQRSMNIVDAESQCPDAFRLTMLIHASRVTKDSGRPAEAVTLQQRAADLAAALHGDHSDQYLEQLGTLKRHCIAAGDQARADLLADEHLLITREVRDGILPPASADLSTPALCRRYSREALMCSRWLLKHYITHPDMPKASNFIVQFCRRSPDVSFYFGPVEKKWNKRAVPNYLVAYMAASVEYALTHSGEPRFSFGQYKYAINRLIDYYSDNKTITGTVWAFENYIKLRNKGPMELDMQLTKDFDAYKDYMSSRRKGDIEVDSLVMMGISL